MNNKEFKKINESWDKFLNEEIKELSEEEQIDEAVVTAALVAKLIYILSQKDNLKKVTQALLTRQDLPPSVRKILETVDLAVNVVEEEMPTAARKAVELRGKAPDSWVGNMLTSIFARCISDKKCMAKEIEGPVEEPEEVKPEEPSGEE